jgi:Helicase conserved C-terminal domain/SNF2-related domain
MKLIDNINELLGNDLKDTLQSGNRLKVAASCFSIYAFEALKAEFEGIEAFEFIFTSPQFSADEVTDAAKKERREFHIPKSELERSFYGSEFEVQLRNKLTQRAIARECADWIKRKAKFRSNKSTAPMQQFAAVHTGSANTVYMPLHGFTAVDLGYQAGDAVSNIVNRFDEHSNTSVFISLFDQLWNDDSKVEDVTNRVCEHIASVYKENSPERIYFLMLYNIFNEFLEDLNEDLLPNDRTGYLDTLVWKKLFNFQRDAATGIINKLETFNGCILADSVGLGKTFTALAVIKYYELRNRSVLVLCPKKLADNWLTFNSNLKTNVFARDQFRYDVLCHTDLQRTSGESFGIPLNRVNWGNYDLVVIDESHNFRNNDAYKDHETRYQKLLNSVIRQGVKTKVLMLSATPVNNRFNDLRNQLALAYEGNDGLKNAKLGGRLRTEKDIDKIFRDAQAVFNGWSKLAPEDRTANAILKALDFDFFALLDSVTIARSRKHIETFYDTQEIGKFPLRLKPKSFHCPLTDRTDVIGFNEIFNRLSQLLLAVYAPVSFILPSRIKKYEALYDTEVGGGGGKLKQADRERSLQSLMTTNLLKRLESSVAAFRLTLQSLQKNHRRALGKITQFKVTGASQTTAEVSIINPDFDEDNEDFDFDNLEGADNDLSTGGKVNISLADMDLESWNRDLTADLAVIDSLLSEMEKITPADDAKLAHLKAQIEEKLAQPINPGNRKLLIFTAFADTAHYLYEHLADNLLSTHGLHSGRVTGTDAPKTTLKLSGSPRQSVDFQMMLTLFAPLAKEKSAVLPNEPGEIDILIATDCISEGQNLQDCDTVINYDIHWNPVRIIQRFGRVDRIGSPNTSIQLVNYWPDITLDEYIRLKERVESRMMIADVTATGDDNVLSAQANDVAYRKEQLRRLQDEVIEMEDLKTGVSITDLGLNDFRIDLLNYIKTNGDLSRLPNGLHAVVLADPDKGLHPGVIFTLKNRQIVSSRQNRLHPFYLVYVAKNGDILTQHHEVKRLLDIVRSACKGAANPIPAAFEPFNNATDDGRNMKVYSILLDQAIHAVIKETHEQEVDSLFTPGKTTALTTTAPGLNDFELVSFLVIQARANG